MDRTKRFLQRHRRGLAVTAAVAGAGYMLYSYLRQKVKEVSEASSSERNDQEKWGTPVYRADRSLRRRFIQNQQDCMFSVLALYPNMAQQILEELRVEPILADLQQKRVATTVGTSSVRALSASDEGDVVGRASMITTNTSLGEEGDKAVLVSQPQRKSKTELWNELKIMSIS
jgi:peroxin-3